MISASKRVAFGEHHQSTDGYLSCPLVFAAAAAAITKRIRIRISILLALLYDPLRLAEEVTVADLCTQGRLDLALGVGYVEDDFSPSEPTTTVVDGTSTNWSRSCDGRGPGSPSNTESRPCE